VTSTSGDAISAGLSGLGTGKIVINGSGNASSSTGYGILGITLGAVSAPAGTNAIWISGSGSASGSVAGVGALIQGSPNVGNILIDRSGAISGASFGILAISDGPGSITITGNNAVTATAGIGIQAL